jgi:transporter family protein
VNSGLPLWFIWALLSAIFTGATAVLAKIGLEEVDPDLATLIRTFVVAIFLPLLIFSSGKWSNPFLLSPRTWIFVALSGITTGLSWVCFFRALKQGDVSLVVPVDRLSLLVVALLGFLVLGERPSPFSWLGLLLVGGGGLLFCLAE